MDNDIDQIWVAAYGIAMTAITIGRAVRGETPDVVEHVDAMDESAKLIANRVTKTVRERAQLVDASKGKRS